MVYFFCVLLVLLLMSVKARGFSGTIGLAIIVISLIYAILKTGGFL